MTLYKVVKTEDASDTLYSEYYKEHYHSKFGAINESEHIFIEAGLRQIEKDNISIFEMGFGTGLNALLTLQYANEYLKRITYSTIEKHVLDLSVISEFNPVPSLKEEFFKLHSSLWEKEEDITTRFNIIKYKSDIKVFTHKTYYDLIYYDAFSPDVQPDLWSEAIFKQIFEHLKPEGIFMTYTVKGDVKRALKSVGFKIEKLPGPRGKREILRARKL